MSSRSIHVETLSRVEGEGGLYVKMQGNTVKEVRLNIFEPPRFFEALLRGRDFREAPDITARICGICPVAYQMSAVHAMEKILGTTISEPVRMLRRLLYCGEWIESHALHIYMLHAPDFLGYPDVIQMAKDHPNDVKRGLMLKKAGNEIVRRIGGREIHPINVRVGGFYRMPEKKNLLDLSEQLRRALEAAYDTIRWVSEFPIPECEFDYEFVSLVHAEEYPMNEGRIVSSRGLNVDVSEYENHFIEEHVPQSNALHSFLRSGDSYLTGPLARYNLNHDRLTSSAKNAARDAGLSSVCRNPFQSILVRGVETVYACEEAIRIIEEYERPIGRKIDAKPRAGIGHACTEAPRGSLYHRYEIDENGMIVSAKIVPPTSQNQKVIEEDLGRIVSMHHTMSRKELTLLCEQTVRNYDPCISCATHFLKLNIEKEP